MKVPSDRRIIMIRKEININNFVNNFNKAHPDYYLSTYAVVRDAEDKVVLSIPIPINGDENNVEKYDRIIIDDIEEIKKSIEWMLG